MFHRCSGRLLTVFFLFQILLLLYLGITVILNFKTPEFRQPCTCDLKEGKIQELQTQLTQLQAKFEAERIKCKELPSTKVNQKPKKSNQELTKFLPRADKHELANNVLLFAEYVSIILYKQSTSSFSCVEASENSLKQLYPKTKILSTRSAPTIGAAFNLFIRQVKTKYFLLLDCEHELFHPTSDYSHGWLLDALENIPELDFVSGSILDSHDHLEIPCYRLKLCNWTFSEKYEYERSVSELMICENIAPSFMGRTSSIERLFSDKTRVFDEKMTKLCTTDFFIRAKKAGALSGIRPEVMLKINRENALTNSSAISTREHFLALLPFAHKHKVFRFKRSNSEMLDLCGSNSPILGEDICDERVAHKIMLSGEHWAYAGTFAYPFIINRLQGCLFSVADFLSSRGIPFSIDGGVALGAIKMRGVLPWDSGDIDLFAYYESREKLFPILSKFANDNNFSIFNNNPESIDIFCYPKKFGNKLGGIVTIFVHSEKPIPELIKIETNGRWIPYVKGVFRMLRKYYKTTYLETRAFKSNELAHCKKDGHNACLPDFRELDKIGKAGTYREIFCQT